MKNRLSIFLIALSLAAGLALEMPTNVSAQGVELGDGVVITAEVVAIDRVDRTLALLGPDGNVVAVEVSHAARNFDQIGCPVSRQKGPEAGRIRGSGYRKIGQGGDAGRHRGGGGRYFR